ncbi:MAG: stage III sporulation protein AB [Clostridia bacterium]|nr:stage III sporulation protein AB [Clostridia bacterium]
MNIKYIGLFLIFIVCTFFGSGLALAEKKRIERSEALRALIAHISREIECFRTPLENIYSSFSSEVLEKNAFLQKVRISGLECALEGEMSAFCFDEKSFAALVNFAEFLGKSEYSDQTARCKYILSVLDEDLKIKRENYPKNRKMYSSLGILAGIMIVILLL